MARPKDGVPYLRWKKWVVRDPELRVLSAKTEKAAFAEAAATKPRVRKPGIRVTENPVRPPGSEPGNAGTPLDAWLGSLPSEEEQSAGFDQDDGSSFSEPSYTPENPLKLEYTPNEKPPVPGELTISKAERDQFHNLLSGIVTRANVITLGYSIKLFGRQPAEPSPADTALLEKAWAAQLSMWFGSTEIAPWVLILAASAGMGLGMWAGGDPLPPKFESENQQPLPEGSTG